MGPQKPTATKVVSGNGADYVSSGSFSAGSTPTVSEPYIRIYISEDADNYYFAALAPPNSSWTLPTGWPGGTYYNFTYNDVPNVTPGSNWPRYMMYLADQNGNFLYGLMDSSGLGAGVASSILSKQCITLNLS